MKYYEIEPDFETKYFRYFGWSETPEWAGAFALSQDRDGWSPRQHFRFEHGGPNSYGTLLKGGRLCEDSVARLQALYCVSRTKGERMHVLGCFSANIWDMPVVAASLGKALADLGEGLLELVEIPKVADGETGKPIAGGPFRMVNVLERRDGWDRDLSEIHSIPRKDGTHFNSVHPNRRALRPDVVADGIIWRDSLTGDVLCSDRFRDVAQAAGCRGWRFSEVKLAAAPSASAGS